MTKMQSNLSNEISASIGAGGAPSDVVAILAPEKTSCRISWNKSEDPAVSGYKIYYQFYDGAAKVPGDHLSLLEEPITPISGSQILDLGDAALDLSDPNRPSVYNLILNTPYWFQVSAMDDIYESTEASMPRNLTPIAAIMSSDLAFAAPTGVKMIYNQNDKSITFTWNAVE
jgi:hypothetical protein